MVALVRGVQGAIRLKGLRLLPHSRPSTLLFAGGRMSGEQPVGSLEAHVAADRVTRFSHARPARRLRPLLS